MQVDHELYLKKSSQVGLKCNSGLHAKDIHWKIEEETQIM